MRQSLSKTQLLVQPVKELEHWFSTGVPQGGARGAASYHISMDIRPILTPRGAAGRW